MKTKIIMMLMAMILGLVGIARSEIVELPLGCEGTYNQDMPYWTGDFDLEVAFTEISNVYIDWDGGITAGLAIRYADPDNPLPLGVGTYASLGFNPSLRRTTVWGGGLTYPDPESFDGMFEIELTGSSTWSDILDGEGTITIGYEELIILEGRYVESGSVVLNRGTLVVDGVVVPEPATILFFSTGSILMGVRRITSNSCCKK